MVWGYQPNTLCVTRISLTYICGVDEEHHHRHRSLKNWLGAISSEMAHAKQLDRTYRR
jgi:hypothetical protein